MEEIRAYIEQMFAGREPTPENMELKDRILADATAVYEGCMSEGRPEEEALAAAKERADAALWEAGAMDTSAMPADAYAQPMQEPQQADGTYVQGQQGYGADATAPIPQQTGYDSCSAAGTDAPVYAGQTLPGDAQGGYAGSALETSIDSSPAPAGQPAEADAPADDDPEEAAKKAKRKRIITTVIIAVVAALVGFLIGMWVGSTFMGNRGGEAPAMDGTFDGEMPEGEAPDGEAPDGEAPDGEMPEGEAPGSGDSDEGSDDGSSGSGTGYGAPSEGNDQGSGSNGDGVSDGSADTTGL